MRKDSRFVTKAYLNQWKNNHIISKNNLIKNIDPSVKFHNGFNNVLSSEAACINILGNLNKQ